MKNGLFLQGGGAKGAFQAGAIKAMKKKGIRFSVISGTSIGAINGMMLLYGGENKMQFIWSQSSSPSYGKDMDVPILESGKAVNAIADFIGNRRNPEIKHFFVNYLSIENATIHHRIADLCREEDDKVREYVRASSLLPNSLSWKGKTWQEMVASGAYDGYLIDGGMENNHFMEPFLEKKVDTLYAVVFDRDFEVPKPVLDRYTDQNIILIRPETVFQPDDGKRFEKKLLKAWFTEGYRIAKNVL